MGDIHSIGKHVVNHPSDQEDLLTYFAGTYSITVTDSLGCSSGEVYTIPSPDSIEVSGFK